MAIETNWCIRENISKWCRKKEKEGRRGFGGFYLGFSACYRPKEDVVCLGIEHFLNYWLRYEDDSRLLKYVVEVVRHEEDHRAIYYVTHSTKATLAFDYLFKGLYDYEKNREWFGLSSDLDLLKPMRWKSLKARNEYMFKVRNT